MEIRLLDSQDAGIYRELRLKSLKENAEAFLTTYEIEKEKPIEQLEQNLKVTEDRFTFGAFVDHELVGIVTFVREYHPKLRHKGNVYGMYVASDRRGKGIGRALLELLIARARQCIGLEQMNLVVMSDNIAAIRLYEAVGFVRYGTEIKAIKSGEQYWDEDYMCLRLTS
ncbi:GNAT family N-acetyltransferase [Paenibacillus xylaniclasticus]|uniref:GNAT family N-acetyltransferase n=1 Tax=Paenibacillus xylaniclasticus TaxID=588083 RepID=UPI000FD73A04|nr:MULTISPECIES: GNAT family N-acetyltransferase [Paenibacillus]GFN31774.1 N-acetyltransferase [Paenibacillus curdlanolyticus]